MEDTQANFEKVIPTAWMVAYRRTFSDIPYSQEIFDKLEEIRKRDKLEDIPSELKKPELAPQFEARHKLIDRLISQSNTGQVLELASGFSSRGLVMSKDNGINYVEMDLPSVIQEKKQIVGEIALEESSNVPSNLYFVPGNVLDFESFERAVKHFDG